MLAAITPPPPEPPPPKPLNAARAPEVPPGDDMGAIPLIAHLQWPDRTEWRAVTARCWTRTLVQVTWPPIGTARGGWCWLAVDEVRRTMVIHPSESGEARADERAHHR